ncbi:transposase [Streptomyces sp. R-74717]
MRSGSNKNATYTAFREVGRAIRTIQLLRYLSDASLRRRVTAATNKVEAFNNFSKWVGFGNGGVLADNDPLEQEKAAKFNALLANAIISHNALGIAEIVRRLQGEGEKVDPEDLAQVSPYLTEHIRRFGGYSTHELADEPDAYDPHLDVDFTPICGDGPPTDGFSQAAREPAKGRVPSGPGACRRAPHGAVAPRPRADRGNRVEVTAIGRPARRCSPG